ncbi:MAG: redoxin domain-containing protein [Isosphaeraceae bacterium]
MPTARRFFLPAIAPMLATSLLLLASSAAPAGAQYLKAKDSAPAPEFRGVTDWIQSEPLTMKGLRGKVVVVHFWTHGCYNCRNNYEHYRAWQERYAGKDVVIIGIHTPETPGEARIEGIKAQAQKNGLKFAIAVDNDGANWRAWENRFWPTVYVIDRDGTVRYGWEGELNYKGAKGEETVRKMIDSLLAEKPNGRGPASQLAR